MYQTTSNVALMVLFFSFLWFIISALRIILPRWRRSGIMQAKLSGATVIISFATAITASQLVYKDYGLTSQDGLADARAARTAIESANLAALNAKLQSEAAEAKRKREAQAQSDAKARAEAEARRKETSLRDRENADLAERSVNSAYILCQMIDHTGLGSSPCEVSGWNSSVTMTLDMASSEARDLCKKIVGIMKDRGNPFDERWTLQIRSPYSAGASIAFCNL